MRLLLAAALASAAVAATAAAPARAARGPEVVEQARGALEAGRYLEAARTLSGLQLQRLRSRHQREAYALLGQSYERLGQLDVALRTYQLGVALHPKDINLLTFLAGLLHRTGLDESARPFYERILKLHPNNAAAHLGLGETERALGFLDRASDHYEIALNEWSDNPSIWRDFSEILAARRDYPRAIAAVERSLAIAFDIDALLDLARWQRGAGLPQAHASLQRAVAAAPSRPDLPLQQALWLLEDGRFQEASNLADGVLRGLPRHPLALWVRANAAFRRGDLGHASRDLEAAAAQRDSPFIAAAAEEQLRGLR